MHGRRIKIRTMLAIAIQLTLAVLWLVEWWLKPQDGILLAGPVVPFLPLIISAAGGVAGAFGKSQPKTSQSTQTSDTTNLSENIFGRRQRELQKQIGDLLMGMLTQGPQVSQAERDMGRTNINNTWQGLSKNLESAMTSRGFGDSGKMGAGFKGLEIGRANAFQGLESQLRQEAQARFERMLSAAQQYSTLPRKVLTTGHGEGTGTQTLPGQSLLSGLGGLGSDIGSMLLLRSLLGGGQGFNAAGTGGVGGIGYSIPGDILSGLQGGG